jgi:hypothetical protein
MPFGSAMTHNVPHVAEIPSEARDLGEGRQAEVGNTVLCAVSNKFALQIATTGFKSRLLAALPTSGVHRD